VLIEPVHKHNIKGLLGLRHEVRRVHLHHLKARIVIRDAKALAQRDDMGIDLHHRGVRMG
jgi:hypothetical protein